MKPMSFILTWHGINTVILNLLRNLLFSVLSSNIFHIVKKANIFIHKANIYP